MPAVSVFLLRDEAGMPIAFKAGFACAQRKYYSWLGGVHPAHRGRGLAGLLMLQQHRWLAGQGYILVETSTQRDNSAMSQLNLRQQPGMIVISVVATIVVVCVIGWLAKRALAQVTDVPPAVNPGE